MNSKYDKVILGRDPDHPELLRPVIVDVYAVLQAFDVGCPAVQHALKKLLQPGNRGHKGTTQDLEEAIQSIERAIEMEIAKEGH